MEDNKQHLSSSTVAEQTNPAIYTCICARRVLHRWHWLGSSRLLRAIVLAAMGIYFAQLIFVNKLLLKFVALFVAVYRLPQLNIRPLGGDTAPG